MANDFIRRSEVFSYLKTATVSGAAVYSLMGDGISELNDELNPVTDSSIYIMDAAATTTVQGYEPAFTLTMHNSKTDPVAVYLREMGKALAIGESAQTTMVRYDGWEVELDYTVPAKLYNVALAFDHTDNGDGGSKTELAATIHVLGDPVDGTFNISSKAFTETVVS